MRMHPRRFSAAATFVLLSVLLLVGCGTTVTAAPPRAVSTNTPIPVVEPQSHEIIIPHTDIFAPYIVVTNVGDTVNWSNDDTMLHTIVSGATTEGGAINPIQFQFVLPAGKQTGIVLRQAGVYYYYCAVHASLNAQGRAAAFPTVRPYPVPMDGIIYVQGTDLSGLASAAVAISSNNEFTPWITIVNNGGTVTWTNQTAQRQSVQSVPNYGLVDPTPLGFQLAPGASQTITFQTPGVYDYYAAGAAKLDRTWMRPVALPGATGYPVAMEGIVVVLD